VQRVWRTEGGQPHRRGPGPAAVSCSGRNRKPPARESGFVWPNRRIFSALFWKTYRRVCPETKGTDSAEGPGPASDVAGRRSATNRRCSGTTTCSGMASAKAFTRKDGSARRGVSVGLTMGAVGFATGKKNQSVIPDFCRWVIGVMSVLRTSGAVLALQPGLPGLLPMARGPLAGLAWARIARSCGLKECDISSRRRAMLTCLGQSRGPRV
jgi:hypothetical protein